jgi:hypothetical protein
MPATVPATARTPDTTSTKNTAPTDDPAEGRRPPSSLCATVFAIEVRLCVDAQLKF